MPVSAAPARYPPRVVQGKAEAEAEAEAASTVEKLNEWQQRKDENAGKAEAAKGKAAIAGRVKLAATLLGGLWFVPGAGTLAKAIGGVAALTKSNLECQACCFKFMSALAGFAVAFKKWAALGKQVPGFAVFQEATTLVDEYLHNDGFASLKTADKKLDADAWTQKFRALQLDLVTAISLVRPSTRRRTACFWRRASGGRGEGGSGFVWPPAASTR